MIIYSFLYLIFILISIPLLIIRGKWHPGFRTRLGIWPQAVKDSLKKKDNIWIHAVSVGEIFAVQGLIQQLKKSFPASQIVLSTVTKTGYELASHKFKDEIVIYAPLDFGFSVARYIHFIKPKIYISAETEIWPNLFLSLHRHGIKIVLVNGRISEKSLRRYKLVKPFFHSVMNTVTYFCMQTETDAQRVRDLGASAQKVMIVGNMKFDDVLDQAPSRMKNFQWLSRELLWVAGSTHRGEEVIVLRVFKKLQAEFVQLRLMIAPRHVERAGEVEEVIREHSLTPKNFSKFNGFSLASHEIILVDTIGDLRYLYSFASVAFIGKSLAAHGGQNVLEPAFFAKPIVVGPNMQNFKDVLNIFKTHGALLTVQDETDLYETLRGLLGDVNRRQQIGRAAKDTLFKFRGATAHTLQAILPLLSPKI